MAQQSPDRIALLEARITALESRLAADQFPHLQDFKSFLINTAKRLEAEWRNEIEALTKFYESRPQRLDSLIQEHLDEITRQPIHQLDTYDLVGRIRELTEFHRVRLEHLPVVRL